MLQCIKTSVNVNKYLGYGTHEDAPLRVARNSYSNEHLTAMILL